MVVGSEVGEVVGGTEPGVKEQPDKSFAAQDASLAAGQTVALTGEMRPRRVRT